MWLMILMSSRWHAKEYESEEDLRDDLDDAFIFVNEGTVVAICDDLETFCDEMGVEMEDIVIVPRGKNER